MHANIIVQKQACAGRHPQTHSHVNAIKYAHMLRNAHIYCMHTCKYSHTQTHTHRSVTAVAGRETAAIHSQ